MIKLGIIGYPLGHTLSPIMHKAALDYLGLDSDYSVLETMPEDLFDKIKYLKIQNFRGFNVTIPLKVWIVPLLNQVDDFANVSGAVNTVLIDENKNLHGYNTDIYGFIEAIPSDIRANLKSKKAAILGTGGASRAVAVGLASIGMSEINFYARNQEKAKDLKQIISNNFPVIKVNVKNFSEYADLNYASIVINTTPIGMHGENQDKSPLTRRSVQSIPDNAIVYDLIYKPKETLFLQYAKERDLITIDGTEMLVLQGAKSLSLWLSQEAPVDIMRQAVLNNLENYA